jgi:hypothetical protein
MDHPRRIARVGNASRKPTADPHRALGLRQQQHTAIRGQPATVERGCELLPPMAGNENPSALSSLSAGVACGIFCLAAGLV